MRVIDFFDRGAAIAPDREALVSAEHRLTYREVRRLTLRIAASLAARAGGNPDAVGTVAVWSPNHAMAFACLLGGLRAGGIWAPINARGHADDNIDFLATADCRRLFIHSSFAQHLPAIRAGVPTLQDVVCIDQRLDGVPSLDDVLAGAVDAEARAPDLRPDPQRIAAYFPTGGTTGRSKAVTLTEQVWSALVAITHAAMPPVEHPVYLVAAPMTHAAGAMALPMLAAGAKVVIIDRAEPLEVMQAIDREKVTDLFLPPTVIYGMLGHPRLRDFDYSSLKHFIYAASPMAPDKLAEAIRVFGPVMAQTYGQAEAPMLCTFLSPADHAAAAADPALAHRLASCGRPTLLARVAIMDDNGRLLPPGDRGEIVVRGDLVMAGYHKNPAATEEVSSHGWHHTGDIGWMDDDGYVYIVDRKKDMIITGGFNVYSAEVENVIQGHAAVQNCVVIGVPDPKWGEAVTAVVEPVPGATVTEDELIALCRSRLGPVKTPKSVLFEDHLPRSPVGKILKRAVRDRFWAGRDRLV
ncbi:AMP-binding protein [Tistrella bauzanensis]|jgi:acyl-CoA synthetase (AMP-forming)/AMP-acid ligase II|uniref:AMP-binding protein n=1 Tax=Tistrella arctica TaxID=3133430 RepID=A0ABU9YMX9_9PROT